MGLDGVELIMEVEDHFGITIADGEAEQMRTVGDLVALVRSRIEAAASSRCLALPGFLELRRVVREVRSDPTVRLKPSQPVIDRLSAPQRRRLWRRLPELLRTEPTPLRRPRAMRRILAAIAWALIFAAIAAAAAVDWAILPLTLLLAGGLVLLLDVSTAPLRVVPPDGWATFGEITRKIVGLKAAFKHRELPDEASVLAELEPIIVNVLGVDRRKVVPSARFVEDLGVG
jgi:acyl carrier protein